MSRSSIILTTLATLGLGLLIGPGFVDSSESATPVEDRHTGVAVNHSGPVFRYFSPDNVSVTQDEYGRPVPATTGENYISRKGMWRSESVEFVLPTDHAIEYKAEMLQGDAIVYHWRTDTGQLYFDFHAHDPAFGDDFFTRYREGEESSDAGFIVAPYKGQHGWYWLNTGDAAATVKLEIAGFFERIVELKVEDY